MSEPIRVLVVDDSPLCRNLIIAALQRDPEIRVIGEASNGEQAIAQAASLRPQVITMDVEMPVLDGLTATERIMAEEPVPILVLTADPRNQAPELTHRALTVGALALQVKPALDAGADAWNLSREVKLLSTVKVVRHLRGTKKPTTSAELTPSGFSASSPVGLVVIASSTGGPQVVQRFISELPPDFPAPVVVVQHINAAFAESLVGWLQSGTKLKVKVAKDGDALTPGVVLVAGTNAHVTVPQRGRIAVTVGELRDGHMPSATWLLETAAKSYGRRTLGMILTGMGHDGVEGMAAIKAAGGHTIAQSQDSCVVFGMPGTAIARGAIEYVVHGDDLSAAVLTLARGGELAKLGSA